MSYLLFWPLLGALIGFSAANKRGFHPVGGLIGGFLLGPLAFLMFFMSGIVSRSERRRKCPFCAEWIQPDARVCKHCGREVSGEAESSRPAAPQPAYREGGVARTAAASSGAGKFWGLVVGVAALAGAGYWFWSQGESKTPDEPAPAVAAGFEDEVGIQKSRADLQRNLAAVTESAPDYERLDEDEVESFAETFDAMADQYQPLAEALIRGDADCDALGAWGAQIDINLMRYGDVALDVILRDAAQDLANAGVWCQSGGTATRDGYGWHGLMNLGAADFLLLHRYGKPRHAGIEAWTDEGTALAERVMAVEGG